jgi:hypothetical protein
MITRVYGTCNGADIVLDKNEDTGRWETAVPASEDGTYILELYAEDDRGNELYFATVRVTFDTSKLRVSVHILDVGAEFTVQEVADLLGISPLQSECKVGAFDARVLGDAVLSEITCCEVSA